MKPGARALGIAESYGDGADRSTLAGAVVRADGVLDGLGYEECTVGGTDATDAVGSILEAVCRPDVRFVLLGAIAPAWYNILDLDHIHSVVDRPVIAVTFEASSGLEDALEDAFDGTEQRDRLERYRSLPAREELSVGDDTVYVRCVGCGPDRAAEVVRAFTLEGGRPEPIRVASLAARAADSYAHASG
ncbi:DUF99 family protein [Salinadaptatus halalkaliphilus]|uniref:UPF0215 protein D8Y22_12230 n=1 Tax=Salinadaptatus halalkaliphilus TaxID=2419781 RepID=A0A4S3TPS5_9EURY|nr:DUF99 family protein [Salinadaptatus halalkaliphilus]THE64588.1 DUF99 family protein [Salinadaptatus halalkaliphilus]